MPGTPGTQPCHQAQTVSAGTTMHWPAWPPPCRGLCPLAVLHSPRPVQADKQLSPGTSAGPFGTTVGLHGLKSATLALTRDLLSGSRHHRRAGDVSWLATSPRLRSDRALIVYRHGTSISAATMPYVCLCSQVFIEHHLCAKDHAGHGGHSGAHSRHNPCPESFR